MRAKAFSTVIIIGTFFLLACERQNQQGEVASDISKEIRTHCQTPQTCEVKASDMTHLNWDRLYVFDNRVENDVISRELGKAFSSTSPYYSNKWFFLKDGQIVHYEEKIIPEIDIPMKDGDVDVDTGSQTSFRIFRRADVFAVEKIKTNPGEAYLLKCTSCSPG